jgi:hypothetical protein
MFFILLTTGARKFHAHYNNSNQEKHKAKNITGPAVNEPEPFLLLCYWWAGGGGAIILATDGGLPGRGGNGSTGVYLSVSLRKEPLV